ncbi:hypothetical protein F4780DRAFT_795147 [Xylariomycetidae sp. FL0641]|nr:hypothetical protein F4780DRAFT_795147 [Xylariomycetidae sp. FL0641]
MRCSALLLGSGLLASVSAHGTVRTIEGANGVQMAGLNVADGTPRDCSNPFCGSEDDTAIIRDSELGTDEASALGRTKGNGPIDASLMIKSFMGTGEAPTNAGRRRSRRALGDLLGGLLGGGGDDSGNKTEQAVEDVVARTAGAGGAAGLPTCADDGSITMTFRQINQDGAGPMTAAVDGRSGGTDPDAFVAAEVTQDVPGAGFAGLSLASNTDFPLTVQMPAGMTCDATVAGVGGVCVVRVRNNALAGPFGGSAAFTMSPAAKKRALQVRARRAL